MILSYPLRGFLLTSNQITWEINDYLLLINSKYTIYFEVSMGGLK